MRLRKRLSSPLRRLALWLLSFVPDEEASPVPPRARAPRLRVRVAGGFVDAHPMAAQGFGVLCMLDIPAGGQGYHLATEGQCTDRADFWEAWRLCGGPAQGIAEEDGTPWEPPTF